MFEKKEPIEEISHINNFVKVLVNSKILLRLMSRITGEIYSEPTIIVWSNNNKFISWSSYYRDNSTRTINSFSTVEILHNLIGQLLNVGYVFRLKEYTYTELLWNTIIKDTSVLSLRRTWRYKDTPKVYKLNNEIIKFVLDIAIIDGIRSYKGPWHYINDSGYVSSYESEHATIKSKGETPIVNDYTWETISLERKFYL